MASLSFSSANGQYESDWFKPSAPFQLDLRFSNDVLNKNNFITIYSANQDNDPQPWSVAYNGCFYQPHINVPVMKVIQDADVYFKIACSFEPTSGSYITAS